METNRKELLRRLRALDTTCVSDAMDKLGIECCMADIKPLQRGYKICGPAFTVHYVPCGIIKGTVGDFLDDAQAGDVIVIDNAGRRDCTVWGDIMAQAAKRAGIEGTVIDGVCRDVPVVLKCEYPVFSRGYYMRTGKDRVYVDAVNVPVTLSDIPVRPGDIILGDDSGVLAIPQEKLEDVLTIAEEIDAKEREILALLAAGRTLKEARAETGYHHLQTRDTDL